MKHSQYFSHVEPKSDHKVGNATIQRRADFEKLVVTGIFQWANLQGGEIEKRVEHFLQMLRRIFSRRPNFCFL